MLHILVVTAYSQELRAVKSEFKKCGVPNVRISYVSVGAGNYNTILHLTRYLEQHQVDFILNVGVCGYTKEKKQVIQVARIKNAANQKERIVPQSVRFGELVSIYCSEVPVFDATVLQEVVFVDMESYGVDLVADSFSLPRLLLKVPIDRVGEETKNFNFTTATQNLSHNIDFQKLLENIVGWLHQHKQKAPDLSSYETHFHLTHTETHIFRRLFYQYQTLVGTDFDSYFQTHKNESKHTFLSGLESLTDQYIIS